MTIDEEWLQSPDRFRKVGSRHHVVPKFVLKKWADSSGRVWVKSKHDRREGIRMITDLGIKDFYTFIATDGKLDSSLEHLLSGVEARAAAVLRKLGTPFAIDVAVTFQEFTELVEFVAFQAVRSPRRRREHEMMVDWQAKTVAALTMADTVTEDELRTLEFTPHQNEHIEQIGPLAEAVARDLLERPVCLITLDRPMLLIGDEMVIMITTGGPISHLPECAMTEQEWQREFKRSSKKKGRRRRPVTRTAHVVSTQRRGISTAVEIAMPISPRTVLLFGPKGGDDWGGVVERDQFAGAEAEELAARINHHIVEDSLDIVVGRLDDDEFRALPIPERRPLLTVCGSSGAAKEALMAVPRRLRPSRMDRHAEQVKP
ncbi:DUF4238 domain-containing protein [Nocardia sp. NPDC058176]|uniref:DUF4238 domain-containing protein n=1 Tax=Nocardia sp. NPDC058176 TaxID=3346368 RepID=UPI0036D8A9D0